MGAIGHDGLAVPGKVELAHEPPFQLGRLKVHPATRQLISSDRHETIEPRVMQVLVALARAESRVVTRDELILWCWDGRIVSDDAINRVIARVRRAGAGIGQGSFAVETITKVGYRLTGPAVDVPLGPEPPKQDRARPPAAIDRRAWIAGAATAAVLVGAAWVRPWRHRPPAEAAELYRRAEIAWKAGVSDQARQAVHYLERAVQIDPLFSDAWGALAVAYTHLLEGYGESEVASIPAKIRSAAGRALDLDPDNADARLGLIGIKPQFRNWESMETELRQLCGRNPGHWLAHGRLAMLLYQVGRLGEGIELHRKVLEIDPMIPLPYAAIARALSNLGRVQEADSVLEEAQRRWPAHPMIWHARFHHRLFSGRPQSAIAATLDPDLRPSGFGPKQVEDYLRLARAVDSGRQDDIDALVDKQQRFALRESATIPFAAIIFALFDRRDLIFDSFERYYLNRGHFGAPAAIGPLTRRYTDTLFIRPMSGARTDPRFASLLSSIGLEHYWRSTGSLPDYRRA